MNVLTTEKLSKAFGFVFEDEKALEKMAIAAGLFAANFIIPIIPMFFLMGYTVMMMGAVVREGEDPALPEWKDWGDLLVKGLWAVALGIIPAVPIFFILNFGIGMNFATIALSVSLPSDSPGAVIPVFMSLIGVVILMGTVLVTVLIGLFWGILYPAMLGYMVREDRFSAVFEVRRWWQVFRTDVGSFLLVYLVVMAVSGAIAMGLQVLAGTVVLICVLPVIYAAAVPYLMLVTHTLYAQVYRNAELKLAARDSDEM